VAIGACSIEKHVTLDNDDEGFDHSFALNMDGLASLVKDVRDAEAALGIGAKTVTDGEWLTRRKYHSSVVSTRVIKAGETIEQDMLTTKNPGDGIPARQIDEVCGRKAKVDIPADVPTSWDMLD
jgi:sialic acid synthase SpsE